MKSPTPDRAGGMRRTPLVLGVVAAVGWALLGYAATHRSRYPAHFARYSSEYLVFLVGMALVPVALTAATLLVRRQTRGASKTQAAKLGLLCVVSTVLTVGGIELLMRRLDLFGASMYREIGRYMQALEPHPRRVYVQRPGLSDVYQGVKVDLNSAGLRDRPLGPKRPGATRILLLGDSVTFGWGVPIEATFGRRLETELGARRARQVETINAGVCGYNTFQELAFLEEMSDSIQPDAVVLTYVDNDIDLHPRDVQAMRKQWYDAPGSFELLLRYSWLYRMSYHILPHLLGRVGPDRQSAGWHNSMESLASVAAHTRARGIPLAVFFFRLTPGQVGDAIATDLVALAAREGFAYEDGLHWFTGTNVRTVTNSLVDVHPNAEGHQLIARQMAEFIARRGILDGRGTAAAMPAGINRP
jgi:lysophospholipase L1-like esterase